jgi:hypothetical protein
LLRVNHSKMIDLTYISTAGILWCATHKYMQLLLWYKTHNTFHVCFHMLLVSKITTTGYEDTSSFLFPLKLLLCQLYLSRCELHALSLCLAIGGGCDLGSGVRRRVASTGVGHNPCLWCGPASSGGNTLCLMCRVRLWE